MAVVVPSDVGVARPEGADDGQLALWTGAGPRSSPRRQADDLGRRLSGARPADCHSLGSHIVHAWVAGRRPGFELLDPSVLLGLAAVMTDPTIGEAVALVASHLEHLGDHTDQSQQRLFVEIARFVRRLDVLGVGTLGAVTAAQAYEFVHEAVLYRDRWADPGLGTTHFRRSAIRVFFRVARQLHLVKHDPTMDLVLPARSAHRTRPLHDDEELLGRVASRQTLFATRLPTAWALGQATAVSSELAAVRVCDVDLVAGVVHLHGCSKRCPRDGVLTAWGIEQLRRRIDELGDDRAPLVYGAQSSQVSGQASSCGAVHKVLIHAGLAGEPDVRPQSLAGWAGRRIFEKTGLEREVAKALGIRSLDRAAQAIGWDWSA